jgi:hypothetical protein
MPVFETYASRVADAAKAGAPDVYAYETLPSFLRKQISQIFTDSIGPGSKRPIIINHNILESSHADETWIAISTIIDRELESFCLPEMGGYAYGHCI